jgi:minor extracellular serine protease Vpr
MKKLFSLILILMVFVGVFSIPANAEGVGPVEPDNPVPSAETGAMTADGFQMWFVELQSAPTMDGTSKLTISKDRNDFYAEANELELNYEQRYAFSELWNGLSIEVSPSQISKLYRMNSVKAIYPVVTIAMPETITVSEPDLVSSLSMIGADIAQSELGYTGKGIKVAIMDTGIDIDHPDFGGSGVDDTTVFPNAKVITGYDFVGDAFNADPTAATYNPEPTPDEIPDDCAGHGTHVAGIIGANGVIKGVAPDVEIGAYRVFGCAGSTTADIMIAAMERARADGMQILNMSIGSAFQWPQYPTGQAASRLVNKGMVVVASIGNSGSYGLYSAGSPGLGKKVIGVGSVDNIYNNLSAFSVTPDGALIGYTTASGAPPAPLSGSLSLAVTDSVNTSNTACAALPEGSLTGKAALIRRGTCTFYVKAFNAMNAGAAAVVLYNNTAGVLNPTVAGSPPITIPVVAIQQTDGEALFNRLATEAIDMTWTSEVISVPSSTGYLASSFSSYGLSPDLALKPDIAAPGGSIRSTYPVELGSYTTMSGTSMASPHVAGAAALLLQAKPKTPAESVVDILQNSADPTLWWGYPALGYLDNVHLQGAGIVDIDDAILATTRIWPAKIAVGESQDGPKTYCLVIENKGDTEVTYDLVYENALSTEGVLELVDFWTSDALVEFDQPSVTVPAHKAAKVKVTITPPVEPNLGQYGGYIAFIPQDNGQMYTVPFAGFIGDYQEIVALEPTEYELPWLSTLTSCTKFVDNDCVVGGNYTNQPDGATYTMTDPYNMPTILLHLQHQARKVKMEVWDVKRGMYWFSAYDIDFHGRSSTSTSFFPYTWDGSTKLANWTFTVPDGKYVIRMLVLKAGGNPMNFKHWETWTSPVITIDRP